MEAKFGQESVFLLMTLLLVCPALTMRTFAEERRSGTIEALLTAPVTPTAVVLGKYLAVLSTYVVMWLPTLLYVVVLPFQYWLVWVEWYGLYSIFIPIYAFLVLPILAALPGDIQNFLQRTATIQWGLMISVFCISHVPALLTLDIPGYQGRNAFLLVFLILVVQLSDVLQYVWGKLLGRTRIAPELSPSKTVEGFIGGVASAVGIGTALYWMTPFTIGQAALISLVITLMGFLGGLVMSAIKRDRGVKDWGAMIEGHGGMLDRLDSVCFSAPVFFHVVRYWWTP